MFPLRVISVNPFTRARPIIVVLGTLCLLHFSSFYKLIVALFICLKLVIVLDMPSKVPFPTRFVPRNVFTQNDIGWYIVASATPLLILQIILQSIQYILRTIALFLNRLEFAAKIRLHQILLIEFIGIMLMFDDKLHHVEAVKPPLFEHIF